MECAEYNVNMDQDERSRKILHQLHKADVEEGAEDSDEVESVIDMRAVGVTGQNGGGSVVGISVASEGTPSKVPLLERGSCGMECGPDLVEVDPSSSEGPYNNNNIGPSSQSGRGEARVPVSLVLIFVVLYIMGGAAVFAAWEGWEYLDSAYFCFITLSTIGLGEEPLKPHPHYKRRPLTDSRF